jgi:hypothetical protein
MLKKKQLYIEKINFGKPKNAEPAIISKKIFLLVIEGKQFGQGNKNKKLGRV